MNNSVILILLTMLIFVFVGFGFHLRNKDLNFLAGVFFFLSLFSGLAAGSYILDSIEGKTVKGIVLISLLIGVSLIIHFLEKIISKKN